MQAVKKIIAQNGFLIVQSKVVHLSKNEAEQFYEEHRGIAILFISKVALVLLLYNLYVVLVCMTVCLYSISIPYENSQPDRTKIGPYSGHKRFKRPKTKQGKGQTNFFLALQIMTEKKFGCVWLCFVAFSV